ncbi:MAG: zf-HC2 domain-containing protein [Candidatus Gastranaerophilales bacterium]|nr:zf-HC2 domain-containing protein [Candidatus Gastranaerophilales bacterium]
MAKVSCNIVQDILPLYYDAVCSAESRKMVEEHIQECKVCSNMLRQLKNEYTVSVKEKEENKESSAVLEKIAHSWKHALLKSFLIGISITAIALSIVIWGVYKKSNDGYSAFVALACAAKEYNEEADIGYLSLVIDTPYGSVIKRIKVEDTDTKAFLSASDPKEVIGVNMNLYLPKQFISENHLDVNAIDPFDLLMFSNIYDDCFSIIDVSVK